MKHSKVPGKITTFYSFKGGVGRTMAVANTAFLAAHNGKRVLVMDWDLEAPGVAYYFRGLLESAEMAAIRKTPGVLDFLWDWRNAVNQCKTESDVIAMQNRFSNDSEFASRVCPIVNFPNGGALELIGAGRDVIATPEPATYEEALARFSFATFFDAEAGGFLLDSLRKWAKNNYDLILIDSRTGLADVAGICTMQIPDEVALCFIFNRQNIDGIAKVAAAISAKRPGEIRLRTVPMRVARADTSEESDAKARARTTFCRSGGLSLDRIQEDFRNLPIAASENVPFYESLAPFNAPDAKLDPLTLNYLRLANQLFDADFTVPDLDPRMLEKARQRLAPRRATVEYVEKLKLAEPARAVEELQNLLDSALGAIHDDEELEDDYVAILINTAYELEAVTSEHEEDMNLRNRLLGLLRAVYSKNPKKWREAFAEALERHLEDFESFMTVKERQPIEEEIDSLLRSAPTAGNQLKRIHYQRSIARTSIIGGRPEAANHAIDRLLSIVNELTEKQAQLSSDQHVELNAAKVDAQLLLGDIHIRNKDTANALVNYLRGMQYVANLTPDAQKPELTRLRYELHVRLALAYNDLGQILLAAQNAVDSLQWSRGSFQISNNSIALGRIVIAASEQDPDILLNYCLPYASLLNATYRRSLGYQGGPTKRNAEILRINAELAQQLERQRSDQYLEIVRQLVQSIDTMLRTMLRRQEVYKQLDRSLLQEPVAIIIDVLQKVELPLSDFPSLEAAYQLLNPDGEFRLSPD